LNEFELIARYFAPLAASEAGSFGLTDDAAALSVDPGKDFVTTTDMIVAGVHFFSDDPPATLGVKLLGVNLSDLAAMGARPRAYLLSIALPNDWSDSVRERWLAEFTDGLRAVQREFGIALIGGDTVATPGPLTLNVTAFGETPKSAQLRRSGARPGDGLYVTGTIGDAALGLACLQGEIESALEADRDYLVDRYRRPRPRVAVGLSLAGLATAAADISDGLIADLGHICKASGVVMEIEKGAIPLSDPVRRIIEQQPDHCETVLSGGDDYELAFTIAPSEEPKIPSLARNSGIPITRIGLVRECASGENFPDVRLIDGGTHLRGPTAAGYKHF
jgi:thiamine-monophosphate kinase